MDGWRPTIRAASRASGLALAAFLLVPAAAGADQLACRRAIGREGIRFLHAVATIRQACEDRRLRGLVSTCPGTSDAVSLARAAARLESRLVDSCPGGVPSGFPTSCPPPCAGPLASTNDLASCLRCDAGVALGSLLPQLYPDAGGPVCGDGVVEGAESCDAPAEAACPGRCGLPGTAGACQCGRPGTCAVVASPPASCLADGDCPAGYACAAGACQAGGCVARADCPLAGECVYASGATPGVCTCRGCAAWTCTLGCEVGGILPGCRCTSIDDCPVEDDVCFMGVCS